LEIFCANSKKSIFAGFAPFEIDSFSLFPLKINVEDFDSFRFLSKITPFSNSAIVLNPCLVLEDTA